MYRDISLKYFFILVYKTLRGIVTLFSQDFSNHLFLMEIMEEYIDEFMMEFIPLNLYLFIKGLIFANLPKLRPISSWFNETVTAYWNHLLPWLPLLSLSFIIFYLYYIYFLLRYFYPIRRIYIWSIQIYIMTFVIQWINPIKNKIITFHWCSKTILISTKKWLKKSLNSFICLGINRDFFVTTFGMHYKLFISTLRRNKISWYSWLDFSPAMFFEVIYDIFQVMSHFNKTSLTNSVLFLSALLPYSINCYFEISLLLLVYINFFSHAQKYFLYL